MKKKFFQEVGGLILVCIGVIGFFIASGEPMHGTPRWVLLVIASVSLCFVVIGCLLKSRASRPLHYALQSE